MKKLNLLPALLCFLLLYGCDSAPEHPEEAVVKAKLVGTYCSEDAQNRFQLGEDGRYMSRRNKKNSFANGVIGEKCEGNYTLEYNEETYTWSLNLEASDKNSNPFIKCKAASMDIWQAEKGYLVGEGPVTLTEPFKQVAVSSDKCGEI